MVLKGEEQHVKMEKDGKVRTRVTVRMKTSVSSSYGPPKSPFENQ